MTRTLSCILCCSAPWKIDESQDGISRAHSAVSSGFPYPAVGVTTQSFTTGSTSAPYFTLPASTATPAATTTGTSSFAFTRGWLLTIAILYSLCSMHCANSVMHHMSSSTCHAPLWCSLKRVQCILAFCITTSNYNHSQAQMTSTAALVTPCWYCLAWSFMLSRSVDSPHHLSLPRAAFVCIVTAPNLWLPSRGLQSYVPCVSCSQLNAVLC